MDSSLWYGAAALLLIAAGLAVTADALWPSIRKALRHPWRWFCYFVLRRRGPHYNIPVSGDMSPETAIALRQMLDEHDAVSRKAPSSHAQRSTSPTPPA
jgi:hypothetical protein